MNTSSNSSDYLGVNAQLLNIPYTICEVLVAIIAVIGNAMVIIVFRKERRLRRRTNYYIVSLAVADFLVGLLGIPFAILASIGLPTNLHACLFTVSLLVVLCTISIFCLVAVSIDRYWAILHPMGYSRNVRTKTALVIISVCWMAGSFIGFLPLLGWHAGKKEDQKCFFVGVMDYNYLVFLYFATIITPSLLLAAFYAHIYRVVLNQLRQIVTMNPSNGSNGTRSINGHIRSNGGTMLRMLGAAQKREVKATQNLSIIVLFFMICWIPLYTINCVEAFCQDCKINGTLTDFCIILSHLNSAGNPLLYAYHLRDFRAALKYYILSLFGVKEQTTLCMDRSCRPSLTSNNCTHRLKYFRNTNVETALNRKYNKNRLDNKRVPYCVPIVTSTAAVAAASAGERANREMWMIAEVPSNSLSENNLERDTPIFPDGASIVRDISSECSSSGKINSGYIEDPMEDYAIGDDDVFYADASTFSANDSNFPSECSGIYKQTDDYVESVHSWNKISKRNSKTWCLSNSSPQLSRSLFLVEADSNNSNKSKTNDTDKQNNNPEHKKTNGISLSTMEDFSPTKSLKLSPYKAMGTLLFKPSKKYSKSANKIEEISHKDHSTTASNLNQNNTSNKKVHRSES